MSIVLSEDSAPRQLPVGPLNLRSGREVYNTGRVLVGSRVGENHSPRAVDWHRAAPSADAARIQALLLKPPKPRAWWHMSASDPADRLVMRVCFVGAAAVGSMALAGWL